MYTVSSCNCYASLSVSKGGLVSRKHDEAMVFEVWDKARHNTTVHAYAHECHTHTYSLRGPTARHTTAQCS